MTTNINRQKPGISGTKTITRVTVTTAETTLAAANTRRLSVECQPLGADVYIGVTGMTTSTGTLIVNGDSYEDRDSSVAIKGRTSTGTCDVIVVEITL